MPMNSNATPQETVDALYAAFGDHHSRAVHAKGIILEGTFTPNPAAADLSEAALFSGASVPVTARFSNFTGIPDIPDTIGEASPRGLGLKFKVPNDAEVDVVAHSFDGFPVKTAAELRELLLAIAASGSNAAKPTALDRFLAGHPAAQAFLSSQKPPPVSYATIAYYGVNAFTFSNTRGASVFVRYRLVPKAGEQFLDPASLKTKGPDYLIQEIGERVAKGPVEFDWFAQIAGPGDVIDDPSIAWPESRKLVRLGSIAITSLTADQARADKATLFAPGNLPAGIAAADPMVAIRNAAYLLSYRHRQ
jgi:catalase